MKTKHNKKRNTAFVYEALIKEATISIMKGEHKRKQIVLNIIKKHFDTDSVLKYDLGCYKALYENQSLTHDDSEKILREAKMQKMMIDPQHLFTAQTAMIHDINKEIESDIFNNFVPNYKTLATIDQIFNIKTDPKSRVILENEVTKNMITSTENNTEDTPVDNLVLNTFVNKFNDKYKSALMEEQKELLSKYISSFTDNSLSLKMYLNEEVARLKKEIDNAMLSEMLKNDIELSQNASRVLSKLESFKETEITENVLLTVLRTQKLVEEFHNDAADN
tara:strand:+ start:328 stop:1161 length:834 start_codon:yes stop_codon:yes gene_type:complete